MTLQLQILDRHLDYNIIDLESKKNEHKVQGFPFKQGKSKSPQWKIGTFFEIRGLNFQVLPKRK